MKGFPGSGGAADLNGAALDTEGRVDNTVLIRVRFVHLLRAKRSLQERDKPIRLGGQQVWRHCVESCRNVAGNLRCRHEGRIGREPKDLPSSRGGMRDVSATVTAGLEALCPSDLRSLPDLRIHVARWPGESAAPSGR